jgi:plasmid stabilization system protein ParE
MRLDLEFHPSAVAEARAARRWYARRSAAVAQRFLDEPDRAVERIVDAPARWPVYVHETRVCSLERFPYLVVYRAAGSQVLVIAVAHARRRPGYWNRRTR